ncbi:MAG: hypothetical protein M5R36_12320 [Deltaproteobacteria bacterium]|nr:hypothetical protein [Deltaproteobacteria bacterium]
MLLTNTHIRAAGEHVAENLEKIDASRLDIGRALAEMFYGNDRARFESRLRKHASVRKLARYLRTDRGESRSPTYYRRMIAAYFQEPDLGLTADEARGLTYRHRVDLLRVPVSDKPSWARRILDEKLTTRRFAALVAEAYGPNKPVRTHADKLRSLSKQMTRVLTSWPDAPPELAQHLTNFTAALRTHHPVTVPVPVPGSHAVASRRRVPDPGNAEPLLGPPPRTNNVSPHPTSTPSTPSISSIPQSKFEIRQSDVRPHTPDPVACSLPPGASSAACRADSSRRSLAKSEASGEGGSSALKKAPPLPIPNSIFEIPIISPSGDASANRSKGELGGAIDPEDLDGLARTLERAQKSEDEARTRAPSRIQVVNIPIPGIDDP